MQVRVGYVQSVLRERYDKFPQMLRSVLVEWQFPQSRHAGGLDFEAFHTPRRYSSALLRRLGAQSINITRCY